MAEVIWTQPDLNELNEIAEYLAVASKKTSQTVFSKTDRLEEHPESGKVAVEMSTLNFRLVDDFYTHRSNSPC